VCVFGSFGSRSVCSLSFVRAWLKFGAINLTCIMEKLARFKWPIILTTVGAALNIAGVVYFLYAFRDSGTSFLGPGESTVAIAKPGDYTLWLESRAIIDGQLMTFADNLPSGTTIKVLRLPERIVVPLHRGATSEESNVGNTHRVSVGQITFNNPGQYEVVVSGLEERRAFYLDKEKFVLLFLSVILFGFVGALCLFAGVGSGIYLLAQRSKRRGAETNTPIVLGSHTDAP
jgi:hypothetical protein